MLRYRIVRNALGRYIVLAAAVSVVPIAETYSSRKGAQSTANWLNALANGKPQGEPEKARAVSAPRFRRSGGRGP